MMSDFFSHQILGSEEVEGEEQLAPENSAFDGFGLAGKKISRANTSPIYRNNRHI